LAQQSVPRSTFGAADSFDIIKPGPGNEASVSLNPGNTITVEVESSADHDEIDAAIYDVCVGAAHAPGIGQCTPLVKIGGNTWRADLDAGFLDPFAILQSVKNVIVYGTISNGGEPPASKIRSFRIKRGGSGSGSGSGSQRPCGNCTAQPVPVTLQVMNAGADIKNDECFLCAALNANFLLQHSNDSCFNCCWFSGPVDFCGDGISMGYWKLEKTTPTDWELAVWFIETGATPFPVAVYRFATLANVCTFPITLNLDPNEGTDACIDWPATIRVEAG
jgi:hypothetical protein